MALAHGPALPPVDGVPLWRCTICGTWSHAKRRPLRHKRTVVLERESFCDPLCDNCAPFGGCGGYSSGDYRDIACGPFEEYRASVMVAE